MPVLTPTQLVRLRYSCQGWVAVMNANFQRLNDVLLNLSQLHDVSLAGLADHDVLYYDKATTTFRNTPTRTFFTTTTTTTTA